VALNTNNPQANVDIGFVFNRAHDATSNVALYWSESGNAITTAFTASSGTEFFANIVPESYANLETGSVTVHGSILPSANVTYDLGSPTQRFRTLYLDGNTIDMGGATIKSTDGSIEMSTKGGARFAIEAQVGGQSKGTFDRLDVTADFVSTSATTGALIVSGGVGISGNTFVTDLYVDSVNWAGNSAQFTPYSEDRFESSLDNFTGNVSFDVVTANQIQASNILSDRGNDQLNWNTLIEMGVYLVDRTSWSGIVGAPVDSQIFKGVLEVLNTGNTALVQNYRPSDLTSGQNSVSYVYYTRSKFSSGPWSPWREIVNGDGYVDGGAY